MSKELTAERLAASDGERLYASVSAYVQGGFEGRALLVDGSAYSPSWRALWGGAEVWELASEEGLSAEEACSVREAYEERLDSLTEEQGLYWEEGCLWYESEGFTAAREEEEQALAEQVRRDRTARGEFRDGSPARDAEYREALARREAEEAGLDWQEQERLRRALALRLAPSSLSALPERLRLGAEGFAQPRGPYLT